MKCARGKVLLTFGTKRMALDVIYPDSPAGFEYAGAELTAAQALRLAASLQRWATGFRNKRSKK